MKYRVFSNYQIGYSHVKKGSTCEDYAMSYAETNGKYYICVACDGHSDNNCFRSSKGARFGCESAIEVLIRFFDLYYEGKSEITDAFSLVLSNEDRLKRSIKQCWDNKVFEDLKENPFTEKELEPLSERVRNYYESGQGLQHIYGATFVAAAICQDFFVALHIGDGIIVSVNADGNYDVPLPIDEKSETGAPASLCDSDLFSRHNAFRCIFDKNIPQMVVVSSDGVGDCMDALQFNEFTRALIEKFQSLEDVKDEKGLSEVQQQYLRSCLKYWAAKGNGAEDDCSMAGIYDLNKDIPEVKIPLEEALNLWNDTISARNNLVADYERRKASVVSGIEQGMNQIVSNFKRRPNIKNLIDEWGQIEERKQILRNMQYNEQEKISYYDNKLDICEEYIKRANGKIPIGVLLINPKDIDEKYWVKDELYSKIKETLNNSTDTDKKGDLGEDDNLKDAPETIDQKNTEDDIKIILYDEENEEISVSKNKSILSSMMEFVENIFDKR